jgi:hypothetical protein
MKNSTPTSTKRNGSKNGANGANGSSAAPPRVRRPELPRTEPERSFTGVFSGGSDKRRPSGAGRAASAEGPREGARRAPGVADGVTAGYQVIEDYIRQGQEFARKFWSAAPSSASTRNNVAERMIKSASDLASLFSEFLQTVTLPPNRPSPGSAPIPDFGLPDPPNGHPKARAESGAASGATGAAETGAPAIWIDLSSRQRVEVSVDLRPGPWRRAMVAHDLRAPGPSAARLPGPHIETEAGERRVVVRLKVPDQQPPGVYSGLIIDGKTNLPCGTLAVKVWRGARAR